MKSRLIVMNKKNFSTESGSIHQDVADFVRESLYQLGITEKLGARSVLLSEETTVQLLCYATEGSTLRVQVRRFLGDTSVILSMPGAKYDPYDPGEEESEDAIRALLLRSVGEKYRYTNRNRINRVRIQTGQSEHAMMYYTIAALILGLLFGFFARFILPGTITDGLCDYALVPIKTIFMNALKIIIAPIVYLSIVTCFSQFKNIGELGRIGIKVMGMFLMTTVVATILGIGLFSLFKPGNWGFALSGEIAVADFSADTVNAGSSLVDTIVGIVPMVWTYQCHRCPLLL